MLVLYRFALAVYGLGIQLLAHFSEKAKAWVTGRKNWRKTSVGFQERPIWMHCASLGEFEQGRPVLEALRKEFPDHPVLLSFFSPSGYELRKDSPLADEVIYLPLDSPRNARDFVEKYRPRIALFVKYEFWFFYLQTLKKAGIPTFLIAGLFRPTHPFFRPWGGLFRKMLNHFEVLLIQDHTSSQLLHTISLQPKMIQTGDPRIDRVHQLANHPQSFDKVKEFVGEAPCWIWGSTHPEDEQLLLSFLKTEPLPGWKWIVAPHEVEEKKVAALCDRLPLPYLRYSQYRVEAAQQSRILIIDNIGMLSQLYQYGRIAYIGGGFGKGIHNILEPMAFGLPVLFGPRYTKFEEAVQGVRRGSAFSVQDATQLESVVQKLQQPSYWKQASQQARAYLNENIGATERSMEEIRGWL